MKRQRGRGRKPGQQPNRNFESNGPDVKVRGSASHIYDKYMQLARDAHSSGDRVLAEAYLQFADHYFRVLRAMQPHVPVPAQHEQRFGQAYDYEADEDGEEDGLEGAEAREGESAEAEPQGRENGGREPQDGREFRGPRRHPQRRDMREPREHREPRDPREPREPRDHREPRGEPRLAADPGEFAEGEEAVAGGGENEFRGRGPRRRRTRYRPGGENGEAAPRREEAVEGFGDAAPSFLVGGE